MTGNNIQLITDCQAELEDIKKFIVNNHFDSMVKYLVSYSVIKSCGTIEIIYKDIIYNHLIQNANPEAISYFSKNIKDNSSNPKIDNICRLLKQLNMSWNNLFKNSINNSPDKDSLNSLVELRNQLAHGGSITASINDVIAYFNGSCNILNLIDSIVQ